MNKMMRSVVALLLVFGCTNNVVFAVEAEDRTIPESLIGVDVEAADLIERVEVTEDFLMTYDGSNSVTVYPDYYGGSYTSDDGKLVICIPEDATPAETAALSKLDDDSYVIETVDYSYNTLKEVMGQLNDYFLNEDNDISNNINRFGIYDNQNRIVVSLFDASPEKIAEFKETVCDSSAIIFEEKENIINTEVSVNPGNEIQNGNYYASMGYRATLDGKDGFVTSAHFADLDDYITNVNGTRIARVVARNYGGSADAVFCQMIGSHTPTNTLVVDGVSNNLSTQIGLPGVTTHINKIGATTGHTHGYITATDVSARDDNGVKFTNLTQADFSSDHGDSGGIVYSYIGATNTRRTLGIINGSDGEYSYYSKATEVNSALGTSRY